MHTKPWPALSLIAISFLLLPPSSRADSFFVTNLEMTGTLTYAGSSSAAPLKTIPLSKKFLLTLLGYPNVSPSKAKIASNTAETVFDLVSPDDNTDYGNIMNIVYDGSQTVLTGKNSGQLKQYNAATFFGTALKGDFAGKETIFVKKGVEYEHVSAAIDGAGTIELNSTATPVVIHAKFTGTVPVPK